jgi:hypothetical protein
LLVDDLARDEPRDQAQQNPTENGHGDTPFVSVSMWLWRGRL